MTGPGLLLVLIAAIGAAYGILCIRAAPKRRDNVMFGVLAMTDASLILWRAVNVLTGQPISAHSIIFPCSFGTMSVVQKA